MHHGPSPLAYVYLAAIAAGTATACWVVRREGGRVHAGVTALIERHRLREVHLRDQLDAGRHEGYAQGYADGITRRLES